MAAPPILVTGAAGFIGFHVAQRLLADGRNVIGIDNLNAYYDPGSSRRAWPNSRRYGAFQLPQARPQRPRRHGGAVCRAPVRPGGASRRPGRRAAFAAPLPHDYIDSNISGFLNVLEGCRHAHTRHLLYASSSSVYGANTTMPFRVSQNVDHPLSLYGASKKANELMAHAYAHLFGLPATGLRFFTVYGPWGRPDMAMWLFAAAILEGQPIKLFNRGDMRRDFTYVDDVATAVVKLIDHVPQGNAAWSGDDPDPASSRAPWRVYNIGNHTPVDLMEVVRLLEAALGKTAISGTHADAAGRRAGDLRRRGGLAEGGRLCPQHAGRRRHQAIHRLVPRLSWRLRPVPSKGAAGHERKTAQSDVQCGTRPPLDGGPRRDGGARRRSPHRAEQQRLARRSTPNGSPIIPATNGYPKTVVFHANDWMTVVDMGPRGGRRKLGGNDEVHRGVGEILTTPAFTSVAYTDEYQAELVASDIKRRRYKAVGDRGRRGAAAQIHDPHRTRPRHPPPSST